ncbi:MAG: nucleotidyltransferase [Lachnospiraceae bacterium]|nr:nucleotidyltransferase [Lachnospiraceae bacterium]
MRIAAIICEYNPFHNGHLYQIEQIKQQLDTDFIIAVMSGNFVQRGTPAFCDKYTRTRFALENGIDLVFELPIRYAASSAEYFASGAISILNALNCVDYLVFGTETENLDFLKQYALLFLEEPEDYKQILQEYLKQGLSFPSARQKAANKFLVINEQNCLDAPNNILAIEYLKALLKYQSSIRPYAIKRTTSDYHEQTIQSEIASATAIRNHLESHGFDETVATSVPQSVCYYLKNHYQKGYPLTLDDFSEMIYYSLMIEQQPNRYLDYSSDLIDRIQKLYELHSSVETLITATKTKNFTYARISRYLLHLMLKITPEQALAPCGYGKILGLRKDASGLLKHLRNTASIPIIQKTSHYTKLLTDDAFISFKQDLLASDLYRHVLQKKYDQTLPSDVHHPLVIV